jgi:hypothetical protein
MDARREPLRSFLRCLFSHKLVWMVLAGASFQQLNIKQTSQKRPFSESENTQGLRRRSNRTSRGKIRQKNVITLLEITTLIVASRLAKVEKMLLTEGNW